MPRSARILLPDVPLHIIQRGHNRQPCFFSETDYLVYLDMLRDHCHASGCALHAYVLMTNHVHLLATFGEVAVAPDFVGHLGQQYSQYQNRKRQRRSTFWDGRYRSSPVPSENYLLTCQRYVELNPVRAGMVQSPEMYRWSSYRGNAGLAVDTLLTPHPLLMNLASGAEERWKLYRAICGQTLTEQQVHAIRSATNANRVVGEGPRKPGRPRNTDSGLGNERLEKKIARK
jgi:putative transposase